MIRIRTLGELVDTPHWRALTRAIAAGMTADEMDEWMDERRIELSPRLASSAYAAAERGLATAGRLARLPLGARLARTDWARLREIPAAYQVTVELHRIDPDTGAAHEHYFTIDYTKLPTTSDILESVQVELQRRIDAGSSPYRMTDVADWTVSIHTAYRRSAL